MLILETKPVCMLNLEQEWIACTVLEICENRGVDEGNWQTHNYEITNGHHHNNQLSLYIRDNFPSKTAFSHLPLHYCSLPSCQLMLTLLINCTIKAGVWLMETTHNFPCDPSCFRSLDSGTHSAWFAPHSLCWGGTHMLTPGGTKRSGPFRGEKEWEPSLMFARREAFRIQELDCVWKRQTRKVHEYTPKHLIENILLVFPAQNTFLLEDISPGKCINLPISSPIQARHCYQLSTFLMYVPHHLSRLNHHYLLP